MPQVIITHDHFYTGIGHRPFSKGDTLTLAPEAAAELVRLGIAQLPPPPAPPPPAADDRQAPP